MNYSFIKYQKIILIIVLIAIFISPSKLLSYDDDDKSNGDTSVNDNTNGTPESYASSYDEYGNEWSSGTNESSPGVGSIVGYSAEIAESHGHGGNTGSRGAGGAGENYTTRGGETGFSGGWTGDDPMAESRATLQADYFGGKWGAVGSPEAIQGFAQAYTQEAQSRGGNPAQISGDLKDTLGGLGIKDASVLADAGGYGMSRDQNGQASPQHVANAVYNSLTGNGKEVSSHASAQAAWDFAVASTQANGKDTSSLLPPYGLSNPSPEAITSAGSQLTISSTPTTSAPASAPTAGAAAPPNPQQPPPTGAAAAGTPAVASSYTSPDGRTTVSEVGPTKDENGKDEKGFAQTYNYSPETGGAITVTVFTNEQGTFALASITSPPKDANKEPETKPVGEQTKIEGVTITASGGLTPEIAEQILSTNFGISVPNKSGTSLFLNHPIAIKLKKLFQNALNLRVYADEGNAFTIVKQTDLLPLLKQQQRDLYRIKYGTLTPQAEQKIASLDLFKSEVVNTPEGYIFLTGKDGKVEGQIKKTLYRVDVLAPAGYGVSTLGIVDISDNQPPFLGIGIKKDGSGVQYISVKKQPKTSPIAFIKSANADEDTVLFTTYLFDDKNNNQIMDKQENLLPWARYKIKLTAIDKNKQVLLEKGWNLVSIPTQGDYTASSLLSSINMQNGDAKFIASLEDGKWQTFSIVNGESGVNFNIDPKNAYFIFSDKKSLFIPSGTISDNTQVNLNPGWNAVGISAKSTPNASLLAKKVGEDNDKVVVISGFRSGKWENLLNNNNTIFGKDFSIYPTHGYLIRVENQIEVSI